MPDPVVPPAGPCYHDGMLTTEILIETADCVDRFRLVRAINASYADYYVPIHLSPESFERLVARESVRLEHSAVAIYNREVVGMGLLGVRDCRGWIGGMGVLPRLRGQGIGRRLMQALMQHARQLGLASVQLEVITQNERAFRLYDSLGFVAVRRLLVLIRSGADLPPDTAPDTALAKIDPLELIPALAALNPLRRPWQREAAPLHTIRDRLEGLALRSGSGDILAGCLYRGDSAQVGILDMAARDTAAGGRILNGLLQRFPDAQVSYLNVPQEDPLLPVIQAAGFVETLSQYEMLLSLLPKGTE